MKSRLVLIISIAISVVSLYWVFSMLDWNKFSEALSNASWWVFLPLTFFWLIHFWIRALRWRWLLPNRATETKTLVLFDCIMIGNLMTFIFPFRVGEFARPLALSLESRVPFATGFASVVVERFFDLAAVLLTLALIIPYAPELPEWVSMGAYILACMSGGIFIGLLVGAFAPIFFEKLVKFFTSPLPVGIQEKLLKIMNQLLEGLHAVRSAKAVLMIILYTAIAWLINYFIVQYSCLLVGESVSFLAGTTIAVIVALSVAAPSAPGFVGVYQIACVAGFLLFGLSEEKGAAYSVLSHAHIYLLFVVFGFLGLMRYGLSFQRLRGQ